MQPSSAFLLQNKITAIKSSGCNHTKDQFGHVQGWTDMKLRKKRMTPPAPATEKRTQSTHKKYFFLRHSIQVNPKTIPNRSQAQTKGVNKSQISFSGSSASPAPITWVSLTNGRIVPSGPVMVALANASFR